ncbi:hypothetical protein ACFFHJ_10315 [Planotetraspora thailandica]|nr:hypothetical protein [Planotetraspora thailandica]
MPGLRQPTYLLRQAIERGHAQDYLKTAEHSAALDRAGLRRPG